MGFVVDKAALGQVFSQYFGFPCQSSFDQFLRHHNHLGLAQYLEFVVLTIIIFSLNNEIQNNRTNWN
jgi:hypothetical protein